MEFCIYIKGLTITYWKAMCYLKRRNYSDKTKKERNLLAKKKKEIDFNKNKMIKVKIGNMVSCMQHVKNRKYICEKKKKYW